MSVTYWYWCHHSLEHDEEDTLLSALERAKNDIDYNRAHPEKIVLEDGTVLNQEEVIERSGYYTDTGPIVDGSVAIEPPLLPERID